jgi:pimeloyl-ACP methyl ester carboxylesterase
VNGFTQFYRDWRPPQESTLPVLALHGSLSQSGSWDALAEASQTIRMLCPDQRGFGRSGDPGDDSCAAFASDALALAQRLMPDRIVVMAHSFACSIALDAARLDPKRVAAVVLVDPVVRLQAPPPGAKPPPLELPDSFATLADAARYFRETEEGAWPDDALNRFVADIMMRDGDNGPWRFPYTVERLRRLRAFTGSPAGDYSLLPKAKEVHCPVLVLRGGASKRFAAAAEQPFANAFPEKPTIVVCPESGHFPATTETALVVEAVRGFLKGVK